MFRWGNVFSFGLGSEDKRRLPYVDVRISVLIVIYVLFYGFMLRI